MLSILLLVGAIPVGLLALSCAFGGGRRYPRDHQIPLLTGMVLMLTSVTLAFAAGMSA